MRREKEAESAECVRCGRLHVLIRVAPKHGACGKLSAVVGGLADCITCDLRDCEEVPLLTTLGCRASSRLRHLTIPT